MKLGNKNCSSKTSSLIKKALEEEKQKALKYIKELAKEVKAKKRVEAA